MSAVVRMLAPFAIVALMVSAVRAQDQKPTGYIGIKVDQQEHKVIEDVVAGGPADKAGLKKGDVIVKINGMERSDELAVKLIKNGKPGDTVTLTIQRDGKEKEIKVSLAEPPKMNN
jgi:S1-C subfamily serine protease